jgi:hypothetical protein
VRVVAFKCSEEFGFDTESLREVQLNANEFYELLATWRERFTVDWSAAPKVQR